MKKIYVGKVTGAFGIKGELKVLSDFEMPEKVFKNNNIIYLNDDEHLITNVRFHKNKYLIEIDNIKDINQLPDYRNYKVYIDYQNLKLSDEEYLLDDLLNLEVYDDITLYGTVTEVINNKQNPLIKVNNKYYIPIKSNFIVKVDVKSNKIICQNIEELRL